MYGVSMVKNLRQILFDCTSHLVHACTLLISRSIVGGYKFVVLLSPVDEEDCNGNKKNDENRDGNGPGRDSCFARRTIWTDWEILC